MDRRTALKSMAITAWGLVILPACGPDGKEFATDQIKTLPLDKQQRQNLQSLVDTILPKTDTLGAVELNVHVFIDRILANCYEPEIQNQFLVALNHLENKFKNRYNRSFSDGEKTEREQLLISLDNEENEAEKTFFDQVKELTILGYTTSEYFLTNFTNYQMIPGGYDGCVPVPDEPIKL